MSLKYIAFSFLLTISLPLLSQFAPPAGYEGTTAIHMDSSIFVSWGENVVIERGPMSVDSISLGNADYGIEAGALGPIDNIVVSLGDGGVADFFFETPLFNGEGPDFAIFENSFLDDFLELCFVEVSSDGINYFRFNAISLTQTDTQVSTFGTLNATNIYNLGGKYRGMYGTPFDLEELKDLSGLDVNSITNVKLIDVVGSIKTVYATYDSHGNIINDPWPTEFSSSGFDLDGIGIIHSQLSVTKNINTTIKINVFPNPSQKFINIDLHSYSWDEIHINLFSLIGTKVYSNIFKNTHKKTVITLDISSLTNGLYSLEITGALNKNTRILIID